MKKLSRFFSMLLVFNAMTAVAAPITDIFGYWGFATLQGDLHVISPDLTPFQWLISSQTSERDDSAKGLRLNEAILLGQIGYQMNNHLSFGLGYLNDHIHPLNKSSYEESRPYQDIIYVQTVADFNLTSRTRIEERINQVNSDIGYRVKQFFQISHALPFIDGLNFYINNDTYFYVNQTNFGKQGFSENRFGSGFSYQFTNQLAGDFGYLQQYIDSKKGDNLQINNFQVGLRYRF